MVALGVGGGVIYRVWEDGIYGMGIAILNMLFPIVLLFLLFLMRAIGAGDIKLFSVIGGFISFKELTGCIVWAFFIGAVLSLVKMLFDKNLKERLILGKSYVVSLLSGQIMAYPYKTKTSLIHFSLPILLGLIAVQYLGVWQF